MAERVNQSTYAASRGVSRQAINKLISEGKLFADAEGMLDPEMADQQLAKLDLARSKAARNLQGDAPSASPPAKQKESDAARFTRARADREEAAALREHMELAQLQGSLLLREEIERGMFEAGRMLRDQLLPIGKRISGDLAGMTDAAAIDQRITAEIRKALEAFTKLTAQAVGDQAN